MCLQAGPFRISLAISDPSLRNVFSERFDLSSGGSDAAAVEIAILEYQTPDTDLVILSPFRKVLAKRGDKLYFGVQDSQTLQVLAGSLGAESGADPSIRDDDLLQCLVEREILTALGRLAPEIDFAHAAAVALNGRAILLVGASRSGKTTLSAGAALRGFELLCDDVACIDFKTCKAYSYARKPRLRAEGWKILESLCEGSAVIPIVANKSAPICAVCFLHNFAVDPKLTRLNGIETVWRMMKHVFRAGRPGAPILARVAQRLPDLPCYKLVPGNLEETVGLLRKIATDGGVNAA
jgi:hypothetical protein